MKSIVFTKEQMEELINLCDLADLENKDFTEAKRKLQKALTREIEERSLKAGTWVYLSNKGELHKRFFIGYASNGNPVIEAGCGLKMTVQANRLHSINSTEIVRLT